MSRKAYPEDVQQYSFHEWRPGTTTHYIGKCRQCKQALRVGITQMKRLFDHPVQGPLVHFEYQPAVKCYQHKSQGVITWSTMCPTDGCILRGSVAQQSMIALKRIDGTVNDIKKCDPRCTGATGHTCECSCGGENHGADHAA
jgi:hypothetical protein